MESLEISLEIGNVEVDDEEKKKELLKKRIKGFLSKCILSLLKEKSKLIQSLHRQTEQWEGV